MEGYTAMNAPALSVEERQVRLEALVADGKLTAAAAAKVHFVDAPVGIDSFGRTLNHLAAAALTKGQGATA